MREDGQEFPVKLLSEVLARCAFCSICEPDRMSAFLLKLANMPCGMCWHRRQMRWENVSPGFATTDCLPSCRLSKRSTKLFGKADEQRTSAQLPPLRRGTPTLSNSLRLFGNSHLCLGSTTVSFRVTAIDLAVQPSCLEFAFPAVWVEASALSGRASGPIASTHSQITRAKHVSRKNDGCSTFL